jgi:hypothetical protein
MSERVTRRGFHGVVLGSAAAAAAPVVQAEAADDERDYPAPKFQPSFKKPQLGRTLVQDFVIFAHGDLDMVKRLLVKEPAVLNATMDWGGGDWESGLGGAAHMGRRDIAEYLLEKGARIDMFAAAMLGHLDAVKAILASRPALVDAKGPHGIPLIAHAKAGGDSAKDVLAFLENFKRPV